MAFCRPSSAPMPETRRRRRWPIVLALVAALAIAGFIAARHYMRPETLTAILIANARSQLGAELAVGAPGRFGFVPDLHLVLPKPSLGQASQPPFLRAESADIVVPWSILWSDRYEIRRIDLVSPELDLDALNAWLSTRPAGKAPDVRFTLRATDATLVAGGKPVASGVELEFASTGDLAAWLDEQKNATGPLLPPIAGTAKADSIEIGGTKLEGVRIETHEDEAASPPPEKPRR